MLCFLTSQSLTCTFSFALSCCLFVYCRDRWKGLIDGEFVPLDMDKTLEENEIPDEASEFERLSIEEEFYFPILHLYFNDDLTVA